MKAIKMIKLGLTARMVLLLETLKKGEQTPTSAESDIMSRVAITAISDKLIIKGLITRKHSKEDRRQVILSITEEGLNALKR